MSIPADYRRVLKDTLARRCKSNPRYSLRAFSRDLNVSSGTLSDIIKGKKGLSRSAGAAVARRLGYKRAEVEHFCDLIDSVDGRSESLRQSARLRLQRYSAEHDPLYRIQADTLQVLSEWFHFAILALSNLKNFKSDPGWIAKTLRIKPEEAAAAIERLIRLSLLVEDGGRLRAVSKQITAVEGAKAATRRFQRELLERAIVALSTQSSEERVGGTMFMTVDSTRIAEVEEKIRKFRLQLAASMDEERSDRLYCLTTHFFCVSS